MFQAVFAGRGRAGGRGRGGRFIYTGSIDTPCSLARCANCMLYLVSGISAVAGIMLTVFGCTGYFQTTELNRTTLIVGVVLLIGAILCTGVGFGVQIYTHRAERQVEMNIAGIDERLLSQQPAADGKYENNGVISRWDQELPYGADLGEDLEDQDESDQELDEANEPIEYESAEPNETTTSVPSPDGRVTLSPEPIISVPALGDGGVTLSPEPIISVPALGDGGVALSPEPIISVPALGDDRVTLTPGDGQGQDDRRWTLTGATTQYLHVSVDGYPGKKTDGLVRQKSMPTPVSTPTPPRTPTPTMRAVASSFSRSLISEI